MESKKLFSIKKVIIIIIIIIVVITGKLLFWHRSKISKKE